MKKEMLNGIAAIAVLCIGLPLVAYLLRIEAILPWLSAMVATASFVAMVLLAAASLKYIMTK
jgi:hypothetical protein